MREWDGGKVSGQTERGNGDKVMFALNAYCKGLNR